MTAEDEFPLLRKALGRHLAGVRGLKGVLALVRTAGPWQEIARLGKVDAERIEPAIETFDPEAGGSVEAREGDAGGWAARYALGGPGLDLILLMTLDGVAPAELQTQLSALEARVGWLMLAALTDLANRREGLAVSNEVGAKLLLDAGSARNRHVLGGQWIARLEAALSPDLVGVCWVKGGQPRLAELSGGGDPGKRSDERTHLELLATEALRAQAPIRLAETEDGTASGEGANDLNANEPEDPETLLRRETALTRLEALGAGAALLLPVYKGDEPAAVVVVLWSDAVAAPPVSPEVADTFAQLLSEALDIQNRAFPSLLRRAGNSAWSLIRAVFGTNAWKLKLFATLVAALVIVLALLPTRYSPTFPARIEAEERVVISAPYDGFVAEAPHQLGDVVQEGALVFAMEDSELRLQTAQARSEAAEIAAEIQTARARRDSARVQSLEAQATQIELRLALLERQLDLSRIHAEAPGIVISGDAWRRVGGRVRLGEALLELARPGTFRLLAFIDEDWIAEFAPGAEGTLLLSAYPENEIPVRLASVTPDAELRDGVNSFSAWLNFETAPEVDLLDGMRGIVELTGAETSVLSAYTRGAQRWLRRTLWRWT